MCYYSQRGCQCNDCRKWHIIEEPIQICGLINGNKEFLKRFNELKKKHPGTEELNEALKAMLLEKHRHVVELKCSESKTYVCEGCRGR